MWQEVSVIETGRSLGFVKPAISMPALIRTIVLLGKTDKFWEVLKDGALPSAATILLVGFLVWASLKFRSWYHNDSGLAADEDEMLLQFRDLQRRGDLTGEEFRSIKGRLVAESADSLPGTDADEQQGCTTETMLGNEPGQIDRNDK